ncbi:sensor domain-containing diguanylate cyclase [Aeromonas enteropelogenes]|uniref:GGDEF domain-containing protein n=1 Tax=Aeromonas enteropelogenes TaxID=29489 RepID=UPI0009ED6F08|nr:sensor domain-containing diguanylate cyclase [Aeromonas enteropelogenes]
MEEIKPSYIDVLRAPPCAFLCMATLICLFSLAGIFTRPPDMLAAFWPANAVFLGIMIRYPILASPAGWLGGIAGYLLAALFTDDSLLKTGLLTLGNLVGVGVGYLLYRRLGRDNVRLRHPNAIVYLLLISMAASFAAGLVGALINPILFNGRSLHGLGFWFASELVNYMALLPVLLTLPHAGAIRTWFKALWLPHVSWARVLPLLMFICSLLLAEIVSGPGSLAFPVPALLWCAVSYSLFTTTLLSLGFTTLTLLAISSGYLVINHDAQTQYWMFSVRIGIMLIGLTPLTAASIMATRNTLLRQMEYMAHHDHLTGALNRAGFWPSAQQMLAQLDQQHKPVAVCMLDLDNFKQLNDNHGHEAGDRALKAFTMAISQGMPGSTLLGRLGGEEFALLLPDVPPSQAWELVDRLRSEVAQLQVIDEAMRPVTITVSIGLAYREPGHLNLEQLLSHADAALYRAKHNGRNRVEWYQDTTCNQEYGR